MRARWVVLVAAAALLVGLAVGAGTRLVDRPSARDPSTTTVARPPVSTRPGLPAVPDRGAYLGVWHKTDPDDGRAVQQAGIGELERRIDRPLDIVHLFYDFERPFPTDNDRWALRTGHQLLISWNGRDTAGIAAGAHDELIRARARGVRDLDAPVFLRWLWEMDGPGRADRAGTPASYVAAWRHIRALFAEEGADAVAWVWCPNAAGFDLGRAQAWYPGDDAVDWLCADGYNFGTAALPWAGFEQLFRSFVAWGRGRGKPLMVGEVGSVEGAPGQKAAWLTEIPGVLERAFPEVRAVVYFDEDRDGYDWRIGTSASSAAAFRTLAQHPWMRAVR